MIDAINKLIEGLRARVQLMVGRAILTAINDATRVQTVQAQLLDEETHDEVERIQHYGYTSVPLPGAEGVLVFVGGNRDHGLVIATDDRRYRKASLQPGEVALYTDLGQSVHLTRDGLVIDGAGLPMTVINTPLTRIESDLEVTGQVKDLCDSTGTTMSSMRATYNGHTHSDPQGGAVGTPTPSM